MDSVAIPPPFPPADVGEIVPVNDVRRPASTYQLTRFVLLRLLGLVYFTAFLVAANQMIPLVGHHGLTPADHYLPLLKSYYAEHPEEGSAFINNVSIFWWDWSDSFIQSMAWLGVALSAIVLCGYANTILMLLLWALYLSFLPVAQRWFSYGWDIQILETGFLGAFLCPLLDPRPFPKAPPPILVLWLYRWLIFRIMVGAGLIKLRGDECWRDLTALYYHYETQPVPNPLSRYLHFMPHWFQKFGVLWNHFIELIVPFFSFGPKVARNVAGILMASFQLVLICTGNLSFLNWLTMVPCIACIDDSVWRRVLPSFLVRAAERREPYPRELLVHSILASLLGGLVIVLSWQPVRNLFFAENQVMNGSFDKFHLVNTYGAFGSVGQERDEIIFEGTDDLLGSGAADWKEYEFKVKPGDAKRRPPIITPYHYRLDWEMWFAAMGSPNQYPWTLNFVWKLLHNDPDTLSLLAYNPFPDKPPVHIRAVLYHYKFAPLGNKENVWWTRERVGLWLPSISLKDAQIREFLIQRGFLERSAE